MAVNVARAARREQKFLHGGIKINGARARVKFLFPGFFFLVIIERCETIRRVRAPLTIS